MKKITNFFKNLQFIFKHDYWVMLGKYDKEWENNLLELAEKHSFEPLNCHLNDPYKKTYDVRLGNVYMWVGSYPYSFFAKRRLKQTLKYGDEKAHFFWWDDVRTQSRPSRLVIKQLHKKLVEDLKKHNRVHA